MQKKLMAFVLVMCMLLAAFPLFVRDAEWGAQIAYAAAEENFPVCLIENGPVGNLFLKGNEAKLYFTAENLLKVSIKPEYTMTITDVYGNVKTVKGTAALAAGRNDLVIQTGVTDCGTYDVHLTFTNKSEICAEYDTNFSISADAEPLNDFYAMNTHYRLVDRNPETSVPLIRQMGAGWLRDSFHWPQLEKEKGKITIPAYMVHAVNVANQNGIRTMPVLTSGNEFYDDGKFPQSDEAVQAFGNFVYECVRVMKGKVDTFQIWNEFHHTWNGMHPDYATNPSQVVADKEYIRQGAAAYVKLLKVAYARAKEANPDCKIVGLGCVPSLWPYWVEAMLDAGAAQYMDYMSLNEYDGDRPPERLLVANLKNIVRIAEEKGAGDIPIWITETGWPSSGVSELNQAKYAVRQYLLFRDIGLDKIFWYDFKNDGNDHTDREMSYGIIYSNGERKKKPYSAKPSYVALSNMNDKIGNAEIQEHTTTEDGTEIFKLRRSDGDFVYVLWNLNGNTAATVDFGEAQAEVYDIFGNRQELENANGIYTISVSDEPVYMTKKDFEKRYEITKIDYNTNEITVCVDDIYLDSRVTILVLKPGMTIADIHEKKSDAVCYIDQVEKNANGRYEFTFKAKKSGEYGIYVYNGKQIVKLGAEFHSEHGAEISISQSGVPITGFGGIDKSKPIVVETMIENNSKSAADYMIICAFYADGRLAECFMSSENLGLGKHILEKEIIPKEDYDEIKVFIWRGTTQLIPIADSIYFSEKVSGASE